MSDLVTYQTFLTPEAARPLLEMLREEGIAAKLVEEKRVFDPKMAFNPTDRRFSVRVPAEEVAAAQQAEEAADAELAAEISPDYYLFGFADEELFEVLLKPDEWSRFDVSLARRLLRERGREVGPDALRRAQSQARPLLAKPHREPLSFLIVGYLGALLGGFFGILIGLHLLYARQPQAGGPSAPSYSEAARRHGWRMLVLSLLVIGLAFIARLYGWA